MRRLENFVVGDGGLELLKILLILRVVAGTIDVGAGEFLDGVEGVPEAYELEMCDLAFDPSKHEDTAIAGCGLEVRNPGVHEVSEIFTRQVGWNGAMPVSSNHLSRPFRSSRSFPPPPDGLKSIGGPPRGLPAAAAFKATALSLSLFLPQLALHTAHVRKDPLFSDSTVTQLEDANFSRGATGEVPRITL